MKNVPPQNPVIYPSILQNKPDSEYLNQVITEN